MADLYSRGLATLEPPMGILRTLIPLTGLPSGPGRRSCNDPRCWALFALSSSFRELAESGQWQLSVNISR